MDTLYVKILILSQDLALKGENDIHPVKNTIFSDI